MHDESHNAAGHPGAADATPTDATGPGEARGFDDRELEALTYASVRAAARQRSPAVEALLAELDRLNLEAAARLEGSARLDGPASFDDPADLDEIEAMSTELLMRQACYRAASMAISDPVTPSLAAFLA